MDLAIQDVKASGAYDRRLISALESSSLGEASVGEGIVKEIQTEDLEPGMEVSADIISTDGLLVLSRGQQLSDLSVASLRNYARRGAIAATVSVRVNATLAKAA